MPEISLQLILLLLPVILLQFTLTIVAFYSWYQTEHFNGSKWVWLIVILALSIIGPIIYFIFGRKDA